MPSKDTAVAYFSMEIGLEPKLPTYSGGLGVLAGDTIRAAADLKVPMAAVSLLYRKGYFYQKIDTSGWQEEEPMQWSPADFLKKVDVSIVVVAEGRDIKLTAWRYDVKGVTGFEVPVFFLDADVEGNHADDRPLTDYLYGGDADMRIRQEVLLGIGGIKLLRALGYGGIKRFHMNEGHAAFLILELFEERMRALNKQAVDDEDIREVKKQCVFTTHTPVPAGHDRFPLDLVHRVLGKAKPLERQDLFCCDGVLNMTHLALNVSHYVNGVAKKHGEVSKQMFPHYVIDSITNGVHAASWTSQPFQQLYDEYLPGWREDNFHLRYALNIPRGDIWDTHKKAKQQLFDKIREKTGNVLDPEVFTIGFARRATAYKRADLIFDDIERLKSIVTKIGPLQIIYGGKAHPKDEPGKKIIQRICQLAAQLNEKLKVIYLFNYDMELGLLLTSGVDIWLNNPEPPLEASGTSGMKAALNGVPSLSVLDGWWIEGCIEGLTGWSIGDFEHGEDQGVRRRKDAESLYEKLEKSVMPTYYTKQQRFITIMAHAMALNGSFFNTHRMMQEYIAKAYFF